MRGGWAQHHLLQGGDAPRHFWILLWEEEGNKEGERGMGKPLDCSAAGRGRKESEQAPPVPTQPLKLPQFHRKLGKKDFPALLAPLTKPFPCLLPQHSQLSQSGLVLPSGAALGTPSAASGQGWKPSLVLGREAGLEHPGPGREEPG